MNPIQHIRKIKDRLVDMFWSTDTTSARFALSVASVMWAFLLFWPGATFDRPTYTLMGKFAGEELWASAFLIQGLVGLYSQVYRNVNKFILCGDGILGSILWTASCVAMLLSVYPPPAAISAEIVAAVTSWWILVRYPRESIKK